MKSSAMRNIVLAILLTLGVIPGAYASSQKCYAIQDGDLRNLCLALTLQAPNTCYAITASNTRAFCLAMVKKNTTECYAIDAADYRNLCLALI